MSNPLIQRCMPYRFLEVGLHRDIVVVSFGLADVAGAGDFCYLESETELIFFVWEFGVEAEELFLEQGVLLLV